jgi:transposase
MESIGIDVHKVNSQICVVGENAEVLEERRIQTDRERFAAVLGKRPKARALLEASTESEWVARCLEELGHEVIVADPNFAPMYATRSKRVKTDRRDARTLAHACRLGAYRRAHRTSEEQRSVRAELAVREGLVRARTRYISLVRSLLRREGSGCAAGRRRVSTLGWARSRLRSGSRRRWRLCWPSISNALTLALRPFRRAAFRDGRVARASATLCSERSGCRPGRRHQCRGY